MRMLPLMGTKTLVVKAREVDIMYVSQLRSSISIKYYPTDDVQLLLTLLTGSSFIS